MKYRALDADGDYTIGVKSKMLVNSPAVVAQAVATRLRLAAGEWFLDTKEGLDWSQIVGVRTQSTRDLEVQQRILGTPGVTEITSYASDVSGRNFTVTATLQTLYGAVQFTGTY